MPSQPPQPPPSDLADRLLAGDPRALPRLVSLVERGSPAGENALRRLYARTGQAHVVGITGPPGAGKSTLVGALIGAVRRAGHRVGVVAVDPSSPVTGGALLGDRVRMPGWHDDPDVFVRSLASRGRLGGLSAATADVVHLLDAAGYDPILIETVGAGQDGVAIAALALTVVVLQVPGLGDGVQAIKAGPLEVADLLVVNKADLPGAGELVRDLGLATPPPERTGGWSVPVLRTAASTGEGIDDLRPAIAAHRAHLRAGDGAGWRARLQRAARAEVLDRLRAELERRFAPGYGLDNVDQALGDVAARRRPPGDLAAALVAAFDASLPAAVAGGGDPVRDQGGGRPGPDPVVDVDHDETGRARLEHRRHCPDPATAETVADRGR